MLQLKLTLPLRREKANTDCGELQIELDDLHMSVSDIVRLSNSSPDMRSRRFTDGVTSSAGVTSDTSDHLPPSTNHVTSTVLAVGPSARGSNSATENGVGAEADTRPQMDLLTLDETDSARWTPSDTGGTVQLQQQRQPSPVTLRGNVTEASGTSAGGGAGAAVLLGVSTSEGDVSSGSTGVGASSTSLLPPIPGYVQQPPPPLIPSSTASTLPRPQQATTTGEFFGISISCPVSIL